MGIIQTSINKENHVPQYLVFCLNGYLFVLALLNDYILSKKFVPLSIDGKIKNALLIALVGGGDQSLWVGFNL